MRCGKYWKNTMSTEDDRTLIDRVVAALEDQETGENARQRLALARRTAVEHLHVPVTGWFGDWLPVASLATVMVMVGFLYYQVPPPEIPVYPGEDAQMAAQNMELLEDMEFIAWLVEEEAINAG